MTYTHVHYITPEEQFIQDVEDELQEGEWWERTRYGVAVYDADGFVRDFEY